MKMFLIIFGAIGLIFLLLFLYCACVICSKGDKYEENKEDMEEFLGK